MSTPLSIPFSFELKTEVDESQSSTKYFTWALYLNGSSTPVFPATQTSGSSYSYPPKGSKFNIQIGTVGNFNIKISNAAGTELYSLTCALFTSNGVVTTSACTADYSQDWIPNGSNSSKSSGCTATPYGYFQLQGLTINASGIAVKLDATKIQQSSSITTPPTYCS